MKIAIITGASSGLGVEFSEAIIRKFNDLDEIWIMARRKELLEQFASKHKGIKIRVLPMDIANENSYTELERLLKKENPEVEILINNAGYERSGRFDKQSTNDILAMINLNVKGMTMINYLCIPYMSLGSICIITCSISSFVPIPNQAVYSASKAYVYYLGKALREELKDKGISVLLLCPGNMDTEMNPKNKMRQSERINKLPFLDMQVVTEKALKKAKTGSAVYTPGIFYKFYRLISKILPSAFMINIAKKFY